ncbi:ubiquitin-like modifier HUB1 [Aspergillus udagawae]|nr:ubiquitin-like modifier HUB1 [Aspergillus udagawae]
MGDRSRSRSPRRRYDGDRDRPRKAGGGFRWKDKRHDGDRPGAEDSRLSRGYRDRGDRPRSPRRERDSDRHRDSYRDGDRERRRPDDSQRDERVEKKKEKKPEKKPEKKAVVAPQSSEPMIVVHVNDRLGTKAAIPCLASDPIKLFKAQVAARIGREPHEILLKRQGERPFKDQLTLEDYGVSNGVQLDLEVGTGE